MNKGLEALERLKHSPISYFEGEEQHSYKEDIEIVEKDLNRLNDLEMECNRLSTENQYLEMDIKDKEKRDEALEIIKKKNVWLWVFRRTHNVNEYNEKVAMYYTPCDSLTEEEYELLREVFYEKNN